jgi:hypothetical protein
MKAVKIAVLNLIINLAFKDIGQPNPDAVKARKIIKDLNL